MDGYQYEAHRFLDYFLVALSSDEILLAIFMSFLFTGWRATYHLLSWSICQITANVNLFTLYSPSGPPALTSRPSHAGYLTLSSPLVQPVQDKDESQVTANLESSKLHDANQHERPATMASSTGSIGSNRGRAERGTASTPRYAVQPVLSARENARRDVDSSVDALKENSTIPIREATSTRPNIDSSSALPGQNHEMGVIGSVRDTDSGMEELRIPDNSSVLPHAGSNPALYNSPGPANSRSTSTMEKPRLVTSAFQNADGAPKTPPSNSLITPVTTVTPPTPTDMRADSRMSSMPLHGTTGSAVGKTVSEGNASEPEPMHSHRRVRSTPVAHPPSRLSRRISPPLTPTVEETRSALSSPGISSGSPSGQGGFFSTVFSAAQNAASTFSSSLVNTSLTSGNRSRSTTYSDDEHAGKQAKGEDIAVGPGGDMIERKGFEGVESSEQQPLAVNTLGMGELRLSHLGIADELITEESKSPSTTNRPVSPGGPRPETRNGSSGRRGPGKAFPSLTTDQAHDLTTSGVMEGIPDASNVSAAASSNQPAMPPAVSESAASEVRGVPVVEDGARSARPRSIYDSGVERASTAPVTADAPGESEMKRTGSIRSRVDTSLRRKRESSSATATTTATTTGTSATVTTPITPGLIPRLTGFAVASKKRNRDFHQLFKSVPEEDFLIEDYSAAIQKDILLHGRLYVSEGHICFNSNIFGYITTLVINFDEVVSVEKKNTAVVFPNAIVIQTLHARNTFASLASRESTYDLIVGIWKINHPNLRSSLNGVQLDEAGGGDKTTKAEGSSSEGHGDGDDDEEAIYDEDAEDGEDAGSVTEGGGGGDVSVAGSDLGDEARKSAKKPTVVPGVVEGQVTGDAKVDLGTASTSSAIPDFPGPATHGPTECDDQDKHFEKVVRDESIPAPLGKVYSLIFGPASGLFMSNWLQDEQKVLELQMEDDKQGLSEAKKSRTYSYIKPLSAPIGPKQTKCIITETLEAFDLEKAVTVTATTQTPDVPNGNVFSTKTRYCLTWAEGNATRMLTNCTVEWTGKSWLKGSYSPLPYLELGPIEEAGSTSSFHRCD